MSSPGSVFANSWQDIMVVEQFTRGTIEPESGQYDPKNFAAGGAAMSGDVVWRSESIPLSLKQRIDEACDCFEAAWRARQQPRIEEYLTQASETERSELLGQLLPLEIELRWADGEHPTTGEYEGRFPKHLDVIQTAFKNDESIQSHGETTSEASPWLTASLGPQPDAPLSSEGRPAPPKMDEKEHDASKDSALSAGLLSSSRYELLAEIGRGAMGAVYRARHRTLGKQVAIKVLLPGQSTERFLREAKLLAALNSPYILAVHDFDALPNGSPMLCMDWVEGMNLQQKMRSHGGRPAEDVVLPWMRQVCEGMRAAADQGIIHRDLKPSNILIDTTGRVRVADFGLARGPEALGDFSRSGDIIGTPYYMAPEQAEDPRDVDTRADVYSFGATFYRVLTGQPPFDGPTVFTILYKHKTEPLISPRALNPEISGRTNDLLERCLAKSPGERFQSFGDLVRQLEFRHPSDIRPLPWDESDDTELAGYHANYRDRRESYLSERGIPGMMDRYDFPGGRVLVLVRGNIVEQKVEAIVSSNDYYLSMDTGVSQAIREAGGSKIEEEARQFAKVLPGRAVVTSGGTLPARFVFHGVTIGLSGGNPVFPSRDLISEIMSSCFYHADTLQVRSIAFPLLGTGAQHFSKEICLDTMFRFLSRMLLRGLSSVREARIVVFCPNP
jgi:serine/threonine protein kinase